jgi:hypothetical protein
MENNVIGSYEFLGAGIRSAILDYKLYKNKISEMRILQDKLKHKKTTIKEQQKLNQINNKIRDFESAKEYLFNPGWLEEFLEKTGMNEYVDIGYIRKEANTKPTRVRNFLVRCYARTPVTEQSIEETED